MVRRSKAKKKGAKDEGNDEVNDDAAMAAVVRRVQLILNERSEQEIRATLQQCNLNYYEAFQLLLFPGTRNDEQGAGNRLPDSSSILVPIQSALTNLEARDVPVSSGEVVPSSSVPSSSAIKTGETRSVPISSNVAAPSLSVPPSSAITNGENRSVPISSSEAVHPLSVPSSSAIKTGETKSVPISSNVEAPSLSISSSSDVTNGGETRTVPTSSNPSLTVPSSSAITNGETVSIPISSSVAVTSLSVPSYRALTKVKPKKQDTRMISASGLPMAEVLKRLHVTDAPVKADSPLKPDATNPISKSSTESDAARDLQHSAFPMATRQRSIASSSGPRPHTSMADDVKSFFSSAEFQLGSGSNSAHHGDTMKPHYLWRPSQNNVPSSPAALQQRGGTNNDTSLYESLDSALAPYRNSTLPLSSTSTVPSSRGSVSINHFPSNSSDASSIGPSNYHGSGYGYDMTSGNAANSRLWSGGISRLQGSYRSLTPQIQREDYVARIKASLASLDQEYNNTSDASSDKIQQRPRDK